LIGFSISELLLSVNLGSISTYCVFFDAAEREEYVHDHSIEKAEFHSIIEFVVLNLYFLPKTIFRVSGILISQALTTSNYFNYVGVIFNFEPINPLVMNCS
jgi:hypothetical protein